MTVLGGEPLDQAEECVELFRSVKANGLTTMLFTGYEFAEIYIINKAQAFGLRPIYKLQH